MAVPAGRTGRGYGLPSVAATRWGTRCPLDGVALDGVALDGVACLPGGVLTSRYRPSPSSSFYLDVKLLDIELLDIKVH